LVVKPDTVLRWHRQGWRSIGAGVHASQGGQAAAQLRRITFRTLYVFFVIDHASRQVLHVHVTPNPTASWTAQQIIEYWAWQRISFMTATAVMVPHSIVGCAILVLPRLAHHSDRREPTP